MENNEYNKTERQQTDYSQYYNTENYNYGNAQESYGNAYGSTQNQYNNQQYANMGGMKVDREGRPMKNAFAVQLVFAIVEIVLCCINPVTMVLAIIALVFAIQANTAYAHNEEINFKVKSKVSNILLIIGGIWATISLVTTILISVAFVTSADMIMREFEREYNGDMEAFLEDFLEGYESYEDGYESEGYSETLGDGDVPLVEGYNAFTLNGVAYSVPMTFEEFSQMGYTLEAGYENYILEPDTYESIIINGDDGDMAGMIRVSNDTNVVLSLEECVIDYISLENKAAYYDDEPALDMTFGNGALNIHSSYAEVEAFMGQPTYLYINEETGYENYTWYYYGEEQYQFFDIYFQDGVIEQICIERYAY